MNSITTQPQHLQKARESLVGNNIETFTVSDEMLNDEGTTCTQLGTPLNINSL